MTNQRKIIIFLSIIGILLASYLFINYLTVPEQTICSINSTINCDAVIKGPLAETLGIPTALYGMVGYVVILFAAIKNYKKLLLGTAIFGVLFCIRLILIEAFQLKVYCPVCIMCMIVMIGILITALLPTRKIS